MEYCSFVTSHYIICECGEHFPSEELLSEHLENGHPDGVAEPVPEILEEEVEDKDQTIYYLANNSFVKEELIEETEEINNEEPIEEEEEYVLPNHVLQIQYPQETTDIIHIKHEQENSELSGFKKVVFRKEALLKQHVILAQANEEHCYERAEETKVEIYYCQVCGKGFNCEQTVSQHVQRMHLGQSPRVVKQEKKRKKRIQPPLPKKAVCDVCGRKYTSNAALRYHQRVHTGERPYQCKWCPKAFTMPLFLEIHTRIHTGERPYPCKECPKAFSNQAALLRHERVHTGVKPYTCQECGKSFSQSNSMKLHVRTVHMKLPAPYKSRARKQRALQRLQALNPGLTTIAVEVDMEQSELDETQDSFTDESDKLFVFQTTSRR